MRRRRGQSIVEYLIIIAGIIGAVLIVKGVVDQRLKSGYSHLANEMGSALNYYSFNRP